MPERDVEVKRHRGMDPGGVEVGDGDDSARMASKWSDGAGLYPAASGPSDGTKANRASSGSDRAPRPSPCARPLFVGGFGARVSSDMRRLGERVSIGKAPGVSTAAAPASPPPCRHRESDLDPEQRLGLRHQRTDKRRLDGADRDEAGPRISGASTDGVS